MPSTKGDLIEVKALVSHEMESGQRKDGAGHAIPRKIINEFKGTFNGELIFARISSRRSRPIRTIQFYVRGPGTGPSCSLGPTTMAASTEAEQE